MVTAMMGATISRMRASMYGRSGDGEFPGAAAALLFGHDKIKNIVNFEH